MQTLTSLPNLHPALIHFPIALLVFALFFDLSGFARRSSDWLEKSTVALYLLGTGGALLAYLAGKQAADQAGLLSPNAELILNQHSNWAFYTLILFSTLSLSRAIFSWKSHRLNSMNYALLRTSFLLIAIFGQWLLFQTGDRGGALVYRHGIAVKKNPPTPCIQKCPKPRTTQPEKSSPKRPKMAGLIEQDDRTLLWQPNPTDQPIGTLLNYAKNSPNGTLVSLKNKNGVGLGLQIKKETLLILPGKFKDIRIKAIFQRADFSGTFGIATHIQSLKQSSTFVLSTQGHSALYKNSPGRQRRLAFNKKSLPKSPTIALVASIIGRHWKGSINGKMTVHGHAKQGPPGPVGLYFKGKGTLRLLSYQITPIFKKKHDHHKH